MKPNRNGCVIPIVWEDTEKNENGQFDRTLYWGTVDDNHWIGTIEMIDDDGIRIDFENLHTREEEWISLLFDNIEGFNN
mgnify:CR=1 FL=1